jgi:hypothetical protein
VSLFKQVVTRLIDENVAPRAPFPKGVITPINNTLKRYAFKYDSSTGHSVACALQLCEVNDWFMKMWSLDLTAGSMFEWQSVVTTLCIIEGLCCELSYEYGFDKPTKRGNSPNASVVAIHLKEQNVISEHLRNRLEVLSNYRNERMHLVKSKQKVTPDGYTGSRVAEAKALLNDVASALEQYRADHRLHASKGSKEMTDTRTC